MGLAAWALGLAVVLSGVLAGVYVGFAVGVMPGLATSSDAAFVETMQQINRAIQNPVFLLVFLGAPVSSLIAAALRPSAWTITAAVLAVVTLAITLVLNVPLNDALEAAAAGPAEARAAFEAPWVRAHLARTVTGTAVLLALIVPTVVDRG